MSDNMMMQQPPPVNPANYRPVPQVMKVLGILDYIFAGIGILYLLYQTLVTIFQDQYLSFLQKISPTNNAIFEAQKQLASDLQLYMWVYILVDFVICYLLFRAAKPLIKGEAVGVKFSNQYAWTTIAFRIFNLLAGIFIIIPATKKMLDTMFGGVPSEATQLSNKLLLPSHFGVFFVTIMYPVLCLLLLNSAKIKAVLSERNGN